MPTYVYVCAACKKQHEIVQKITEEPIKECPSCHAEALDRVVPGTVAIQFKGPGFYINDYPSKGSCDKSGGCGCKGS